jgi:rare lipoprotein A
MACKMTFERLIATRVASLFASAVIPLLTCGGPSFANDVTAGWQTTVIPMTESESPAKKSGRRHALEGIASYYKHGKKTASGEPFDQRAMTAAHPTLPFNSLVRVTDRTNGKSVVVRINDRGPFVAGRVIDLSEAAAEAIGMTRRGVTPVRLEVLSMPEKSQKN